MLADGIGTKLYRSDIYWQTIIPELQELEKGIHLTFDDENMHFVTSYIRVACRD